MGAGRSALDGYVAARRARRRHQASCALLLLGAAASGWAAWAWSSAEAAVLAGALVLGAWAARPQPDPERWLRGAAGEVATARLLERLGRRWVVLHDGRVPGSRANIDHLVIGPTGVWVVDSKAYRAPLRAGWRSVRVGGRLLDTAAVQWEASVVADRLDVETRVLVAVHGHGLPRRGRRVAGGVRVVPAGSLVRCLRRPPGPWWRRSATAALARSDVAALAEECRRLFGADG